MIDRFLSCHISQHRLFKCKAPDDSSSNDTANEKREEKLTRVDKSRNWYTERSMRWTDQ